MMLMIAHVAVGEEGQVRVEHVRLVAPDQVHLRTGFEGRGRDGTMALPCRIDGGGGGGGGGGGDDDDENDDDDNDDDRYDIDDRKCTWKSLKAKEVTSPLTTISSGSNTRTTSARISSARP
jgi:hypothetical protein